MVSRPTGAEEMEAAFHGLSCEESVREVGDPGEAPDAGTQGGGEDGTTDLLTQPDHPQREGGPSVGTAEERSDGGGTTTEAVEDPAADGQEAPRLHTQPDPDD